MESLKTLSFIGGATQRMTSNISAIYTQCIPPKAEYTEVNLPSQQGKVCVVTGGTSGVGYELCKIMYRAGAKVYLTGRTLEKGIKALEDIKASSSEQAETGELHFIQLELDDLATVKQSVQSFTAREQRLDILWNNAGLGANPAGGRTKTGHEAHVGTNCLGPFLFTKLLLPQLRASVAPRVIWTSSFLVEVGTPSGGFEMSTVTDPPEDASTNYTLSKTGNWFLASEFGRRCSNGRIISISQNPGSLKTQVWRHQPWWVPVLSSPLLYEQKFGAYTELWAGTSPEVTVDDNGKNAIPWGRWHPSPREDLLGALRLESEGGTGIAAEFWQWCEKETVAYQ